MVLFLAFLDFLLLIAINAQWQRAAGHRLILWFTVSAGIFGPVGIILFHYGLLLPRYLIGRISSADAIVFEIYFAIFCLGALFAGFLAENFRFLGGGQRNEYSSRISPLVSVRSWDVSRLYIVLFGFYGISYVCGIVRFHNPLYFISGVNTFSNMVGLARGGWFILILSLLFTIPAAMLLGVLAERRRSMEFIAITIATAVATITIGKAPVRTITIAFLAASFLISRPLWQAWAYRLTSMFTAPAAIFLLLALNLVRQNMSFSRLAGSLEGSTLVLLPVVNGAYLIKSIDESQYFYFKSTVLAMTPIAIVPSAILPIKNYQEIQSYFTNLLFPVLDGKYNSAGSVLTYTLIGGAFANLGPVGVLIGGSLWWLQIYLIFKIVAGDAVMRGMGILLMISIAVSFRTSLETIFINMQYYFYVALVIRAICSGKCEQSPLKVTAPFR